MSETSIVTIATAQHPADWALQKRTPRQLYALALAIAWHKRLPTGHDALAGEPYPGLVADPHGEDTRACTEEIYDAAVAEAQALLQQLRDAEKAKGGKPQLIKIIAHDSLDHAIVVRLPSAAGFPSPAATMLQQISQRPEGLSPAEHSATITLSHVLWPCGLDAQLMQDMLGLAFLLVYPDEFIRLMGRSGAEVKKKA